MSYDYRLQPHPPIMPVDMMQKYFFAVLFIKSYVYNIKGQAIIFRRKSLDSLMKLLNDFDETYLHSSYEHSYQNKVLSEGNVDFLVKYTDNLDEVISLIDQNAYTIKLSWQPKRVPQPYPPQPVAPIPPPPAPVPAPPPPPAAGLDKMVEKAVEKAMCKTSNNHVKRVKIVRVHNDTKIIEVRQWDDVNKKFLSMQEQVNVGAYSSIMPDWRPGDDALLIDGKYLQRINDTPNYRRVKIVDVSEITTKGIIWVVDFDDRTKRTTSGRYCINLRTYAYGDKIPAWHNDDDALLFDNKYLTKLDVPQVTEGTINIFNDGVNWSDPNGNDTYYGGYTSDNFDGNGYVGTPGAGGTVPSGMGAEYGSPGSSDDDFSYTPTGTGSNNEWSSTGGSSSGSPGSSTSGDCPTGQNPYGFSNDAGTGTAQTSGSNNSNCNCNG